MTSDRTLSYQDIQSEEEWQAAIDDNLEYPCDCGHILPFSEHLDTGRATTCCPDCFPELADWDWVVREHPEWLEESEDDGESDD